MFMEIPSLLVDLYANGRIAYSVIKDFVKICLNSKDKKLQGVYLEVLLEFCELLRRTGCKSDDRLYVFCRDSFASLLTLVGGVSFHNPKGKVMLRGVFDCVHEIAYKLLRFLDLSMNCPTGEGLSFKVVLDFVKFSDHLRMGLAMHQATSDEFLNCAICYTEGPLFAGVVDQLHIVFIKLLSKMDKCLEVMEDCLVNKKHGKGDGAAVHNGWSHYIIILKVLFHISKFYSSAQEQFWGLFLRRKNVLPHMIVRYVKKTDDHRWLLENRIVTDFESRRHLVMMLFPYLNDEILGYEMLIDRSQVLAESFGYISQAMPRSLQGDLLMAFKNEKATGPGVLREWFVLVCQEIFNPRNALFVACPNDHRRFFPNTASMVNALHLRYFIFSGRIIALALKKKVHVGIVFACVFFKQLAGNYIITLEDIRDADPIMYSSCKQILEMDADYIDSDALGLTFSIEVEELGHREVIKLCPGGESLVVDSKNREKYVHLLIQNRFVTSISKQVSHFAQGFADIISCSRLEFFQFLDHEDFDWKLHGSENDINVEDWKAHTKYLGYKKNDRQISWFWKDAGVALLGNTYLATWLSLRSLEKCPRSKRRFFCSFGHQ
ncbi:E3 ubiquitin-protein ligase UPL5 isoform X3 [Medicago truncatula]|uniref:E3 ubiquitin-protein ligase UPL5 isoform X3 n=1 Tax=Medicago truncatula TaxID=3880 RepID=UPI0019682152|nr:E3 ubiquitin-protein ligase UPL5 isoform X3 [Medicago truncatula]